MSLWESFAAFVGCLRERPRHIVAWSLFSKECGLSSLFVKYVESTCKDNSQSAFLFDSFGCMSWDTLVQFASFRNAKFHAERTRQFRNCVGTPDCVSCANDERRPVPFMGGFSFKKGLIWSRCCFFLLYYLHSVQLILWVVKKICLLSLSRCTPATPVRQFLSVMSPFLSHGTCFLNELGRARWKELVNSTQSWVLKTNWRSNGTRGVGHHALLKWNANTLFAIVCKLGLRRLGVVCLLYG